MKEGQMSLIDDPPAEDAVTGFLVNFALDMGALAFVAIGFAWLTRKKVENP